MDNQRIEITQEQLDTAILTDNPNKPYFSGIYRIKSISHPDRIYIGSAVNIQNRWYQHLYDLRHNKHRSGKLQNHYNKYNESDLIFEVVERCHKDVLIGREQFYLDTIETYFNISKNAERPNLGLKRTPEVCRKMGDTHKGKPSPKKGKKTGFVPKSGFKKGMTAWSKGKKLTKEHIEKLSKAKMGNTCHKGHKHSEETKRRIREVRANQVFTKDSMDKLSESLKKAWEKRRANGYVSPLKGKKRYSPNQEIRDKISKSLKEYNKNKRENHGEL